MTDCEESLMCMTNICVNRYTEAQNSEYYYLITALIHDQYEGK